MGWLFTPGQTRIQLIQRLTQPEETDTAHHRTLVHCTRGNILWAVQEIVFKVAVPDHLAGSSHRFIACHLLESHCGTGWGYKSLDESSGPYAHDCPLAYLDMTPWPTLSGATGCGSGMPSFIGRSASASPGPWSTA